LAETENLQDAQSNGIEIDKSLKGFNLAGYLLTECDRILSQGQILAAKVG
jgi:hypothetical protein